MIKLSSRVYGDKRPSTRNKIEMYQVKFRERKINGSPLENGIAARIKFYKFQPSWQKNNGTQVQNTVLCVYFAKFLVVTLMVGAKHKTHESLHGREATKAHYFLQLLKNNWPKSRHLS